MGRNKARSLPRKLMVRCLGNGRAGNFRMPATDERGTLGRFLFGVLVAAAYLANPFEFFFFFLYYSRPRDE